MGLFYNGIKGSLTANGVKLGKVREWLLSGKAETGETTVLDDYSPTYRVLRQSYDGSFKLFYYRDDAENVEAKSTVGQILKAGAGTGQNVTLELAASDMTLTFDAVITGVSISSSAGQVMQADVSFVVNGPLTTVNLGGVN